MKLEFVAKTNGQLIKLIEQNSTLNFNQIKSVLRKKDVKINSVRTNQDVFVHSGDFVEVYFSQKQHNLDILFQDENVIVVNKPQGVEVKTMDLHTNEKSLEQLTNAIAVHRLDRNTSGITILAKNEQSKRELEWAFKNHYVKKLYTCIVVGVPKTHDACLKAYLVKDSQKSLVKIFDKKVENSVLIKTNYHLLKTNGILSVLEVELLTGKTHQIRAHLAHENLYVLGDEKYGNKLANKQYSVHRQLLHATSLNFEFMPQQKLFYLNKKEFKINPNFKI